MNRFREAFKAGQVAAINAESARREIDEVIEAVSEALQEETSGTIFFEKKKMRKSGANALRALSTGESASYLVLAAVNKKVEDAPSISLALWHQEAGGYPCKVTWGSREQFCFDRESLEQCLSALLADAEVGEKIQRLL
ncbi:hypothetical protein [Paraburkholderia sp. XV]|uniref:hypothetical protein n=1 Tax=Paraburkholderia sp. XV TaxID=2831520 RepID=UPI001CD59DFC|nr:hypothetical protein [Paraburkholderia sp. XV]